MTVRITQTTSRLCLAVTKASANTSVNVISRVTFNEYEKKKEKKSFSDEEYNKFRHTWGKKVLSA